MHSISVIICVNNQKYELKKTLETLKKQTVTPAEIIVVDESGSSDVYDYIKNLVDEKVNYVRAKAEDGIILSEKDLFEVGAKRSIGEYITFAQLGDEWDSKKIEILSNALDSESDLDLIVHSYSLRISLTDEIFTVKDKQNNFDCLFHFWTEKSSAIIKKNLFLCLDELSGEEIQKLKILSIPDVLCNIVFQAKKDLIAVQKTFWAENYEQIKKKDCVQEAALYCIKTFQRAPITRNSFSDFAKIVELLPEDAPLILFDKKDFVKTIEYVPQIQKEYVSDPAQEKTISELNKTISYNNKELTDKTNLINKNHQNYLLMRSWLELKLSGKTVSDILKERGVSSVLIYGAGRHGTILFNDLKNSKIKVLAWIDKNSKDSLYLGIPVLRIENLIDYRQSVDAVIITPFMEFDEIAKDLKQCGFNNVISLKELMS